MDALEKRERLTGGLAALGLLAEPAAVDAVLRHLEMVREWNERMNLTAITADADMIIKHAVDSAAGLTVVKLGVGQRVLDVGSGAGFPGVVWKCLVPGIHLVLLESLKKRCAFLEEVGAALFGAAAGEEGYQVVWGRAEDVGRQPGHRESYDVVTARAVAELRVLAEYCLPFVKVGGFFLAMKGPAVAEELAAAQNALTRLGGEVAEVRQLELPQDGGRRTLVLVRKARSTPPGYPRKAGVPERRPL
ncbi:MAG: 16S rRNA (guanine(527)-N(7))-methyltransferase RsmG [Symbiobacterium sp.]|uniref:16S rRNA (guanine(527)-N(7))-methyltransferase RsmG n=1 Tax=Symbiobacterium sp. TaxID=1971213 RepID=UPI003463A214